MTRLQFCRVPKPPLRKSRAGVPPGSSTAWSRVSAAGTMSCRDMAIELSELAAPLVNQLRVPAAARFARGGAAVGRAPPPAYPGPPLLVQSDYRRGHRVSNMATTG